MCLISVCTCVCLRYQIILLIYFTYVQKPEIGRMRLHHLNNVSRAIQVLDQQCEVCGTQYNMMRYEALMIDCIRLKLCTAGVPDVLICCFETQLL